MLEVTVYGIITGRVLWSIYEGDPKPPEFIYKKLCVCSYMFKLQSSSKYSLFDAVHLLSCFFLLLKNSFWTHRFWCLLLLLFFVSLLPHWQNVSFRGLFSSWETKISWGKIGWIRRVGHRGHSMLVLVKNCWILSKVWAGTLVITHDKMGKRVERILKRNSLKLNKASHNNASWYADTDGVLRTPT